MEAEGEDNTISNDANVSMLPSSLEDEPIENSGTQVS